MNNQIGNEQQLAITPLIDADVVGLNRWTSWYSGRVQFFGIYIHFKFVVILLIELLMISSAIFFSYKQATIFQSPVLAWLLLKSFISAVPISLCFIGVGLYSSRQSHSSMGTALRYAVATAIAIPILYSIQLITRADITVTDMALPLSITIILIATLRGAFGFVLDNRLFERRVLLLGDGKKAKTVRDIARKKNQRGFYLVESKPNLNIPGELFKAVKTHRINEVVVAFDDNRQFFPSTELLDCRLSGISVVNVLDFIERETGVIPFEHLRPSWLIFTSGFAGGYFSSLLKRTFDVSVALISIILSLPILIITSIAIKLDSSSSGPVLYRQTRVGLNGELFNVLKFRSMHTDAEKNGVAQWASQDDSRVTKVGRILRLYRIDELPQLFNVLLGTMSLVGPRPERPVFVEKLVQLNDLYKERHRVRPGLTGWAQLRFPYTDTEEASILKLQYDMYYLKNQNVLFDFYIFLQTIEVVLFGKGSR